LHVRELLQFHDVSVDRVDGSRFASDGEAADVVLSEFEHGKGDPVRCLSVLVMAGAFDPFVIFHFSVGSHETV
jgi:hypothetical protein